MKVESKYNIGDVVEFYCPGDGLENRTTMSDAIRRIEAIEDRQGCTVRYITMAGFTLKDNDIEYVKARRKALV